MALYGVPLVRFKPVFTKTALKQNTQPETPGLSVY
jgi:hypothetical protein